MKVHQIFTDNSYRNFNYVIEFSKKAIVVDPYYPGQIDKFLKEKSLDLYMIVNTHEHWDHIAGNDALKKKYDCKVLVHKNGKGKIKSATMFAKAGDRVELDEGYFIEVMDTPGHTFAHLCFKLVKDENPIAVFTGDTLFNAGVGNCYNGGDSGVLYETISQQFQDLPGDVLVYPGHEYWKNNLRFTKKVESSNTKVDDVFEMLEKEEFLVSTMDLEREVNTFLRLDKLKSSEQTDKEKFLELRKQRDNW